LKADGVEHPRGGLAKPRGGSAFDGFAGKTLGKKAAEAVQVHEVGKFEAVTEGSTGRENRIPQAQRANFYAEVNGTSGTHFVEENNTKPLRPVAKSLASSSSCLEIKTLR
jgi:hypothetical protein